MKFLSLITALSFGFTTVLSAVRPVEAAKAVGNKTCRPREGNSSSTFTTIDNATLSASPDGRYRFKFTDENATYVWELNKDLSVESARSEIDPNATRFGAGSQWDLNEYQRTGSPPIKINSNGAFQLSMPVDLWYLCEFEGKLLFLNDAKTVLFPPEFETVSNLNQDERINRCEKGNLTYEELFKKPECRGERLRIGPHLATINYKPHIAEFGIEYIVKCRIIRAGVAIRGDSSNMRSVIRSIDFLDKDIRGKAYNVLAEMYAEFPRDFRRGFRFVENSLLSAKFTNYDYNFVPGLATWVKPNVAGYSYEDGQKISLEREHSFRNSELQLQRYLSLASVVCYSFSDGAISRMNFIMTQGGYSLSRPLRSFNPINESCVVKADKTSRTEDSRAGIDKWWAVAGDEEQMKVSWKFNVEQVGQYKLSIKNKGKASWVLSKAAKVIVTYPSGNQITYPYTQNPRLRTRKGDFSIEKLGKGPHTISIDGFSVPDKPLIEEVTLLLQGPESKSITSLFIADRPG